MNSPKSSLERVGFAFCVAALSLAAMITSTARAQSIFTWNGGGLNGNWNTGANWSGGSAPGSPQAILNFAGSTRTTSTNNFSAYSAGYQILFNSGASSFTLDGNGINFYNYGSGSPGVENDSAAAQTVNLQCDMEATGYTFNFTANNGNLNLGTSSGNAFNYYADNGASGLALNADNGNTITVYGTINNGGGGGGGTPTVSISGSGTVVYAGANGYTGQTDINAGTLEINSGGRISTSSAIYLGNGGTTSAVAEIALSSAGQIFSNNFTINAGANNTTRIVAGMNTSGTSTYSGAITLGSDFQVNAASGGTVAITGQLTGGATGYGLVKTGSGTVLLENTGNNYTGTNSGALSAAGTQIYGGTLGIYGASCLGIAPAGAYNNISFYGNGVLQDTATSIAFSANRNVYIASGFTGTLDNGGNGFGIAGVVNGGGSLAAAGTGTLTLSASNSYSGGTTVSAGTLNFGNIFALGSGSVTVGNATLQAGVGGALTGSLVFNGSATFDTQAYTVTLNAGTSGTGSLTKIGSGTLILMNASTLSASGGGVTIDAGTLGIYAGNNIGALPGTLTTDLTFAGNSTLQFEQSAGSGAVLSTRRFEINNGVTATIDTQSYNNTDAGVIAGPGALAKIGSGTLTLSGSNSYTGGTAIAAGTLQLGSNGALGSSSGALAINSATLDLNGMSAAAGAFTIQGGNVIGLNLGGGANTLAATSATISGANYVGINGGTISGTGTFNLLTSTGGGLTGTFGFAGAQDLTVPVSSLIVDNGGTFYRMTLNNTSSAEQVIVSNNVPGTELTIMPFGSSITAGYSAQNPYDGGGYRTQLYQNLVNDGRFNPNFAGSATGAANLYAVNPTSTNILTTANQLNNEGHPGWTTTEMLANINGTDGNSGENGGYWLKPGNGVNPNYITVNIGGNDAVDYGTDSATLTAAAQRLDAIVSDFNTLRSGVNTIVSTICYRADSNGAISAGLDAYYNPQVGNIVFNHVLAGQSAGYLDLRDIMDYTTDNDWAYGDLVHFTQAGYDKMANAWYQSMVYGAAYWTGNQGTVWNTVVSGSATNWAMNDTLTTDRQKSLNDPLTTSYDIYPDVFFSSNSAPLSTTLGADTTVRSLNFTGGAAGSVTIGGSNTLTIGSIDTAADPTTPDTIMNSGGITVQAGSGTHTLAANVILGATQTWGNVSSNPFTVSGVVSGSNSLSIAGSYTIYNPGTFTSAGTNYNAETYSTTAATYVGTGAIVLAGNNTYTGSTTINQYGTLQLGGTNAGGTAAGGIGGTSGVVNNGTLIFNRSNACTFNPVISGSGAVSFNGNGAVTLAGANTYSGATSVNAGTLVVAGSITGSTMNVAAGAVLASGSAGTSSAIALSNGGGSAVIISGALSPGQVGTVAPINFTLQAGAKLSFQAGSSLLFDVGAGGASDVVAFTAAGDWLSGSGNATLALNGTVSYTSTYTVFSNVTASGFAFSNITGYDTADYRATVTQVGDAYDLTFQAIPEPKTWMLIAAYAGMVMASRGRAFNGAKIRRS